MKTEIITALMKTVASTRPAPDRALIENAVAVTTEKAARKNASAVSGVNTRFQEAIHRGSFIRRTRLHRSQSLTRRPMQRPPGMTFNPYAPKKRPTPPPTQRVETNLGRDP
ncbi:hypothetical protein, partial [Kosakonia sacchari]|uniref:hypothetical protein n=1 Tax=Kosakonia sacchari TaxID=1158459 RepID=UPI000BE7405F